MIFNYIGRRFIWLNISIRKMGMKKNCECFTFVCIKMKNVVKNEIISKCMCTRWKLEDSLLDSKRRLRYWFCVLITYEDLENKKNEGKYRALPNTLFQLFFYICILIYNIFFFSLRISLSNSLMIFHFFRNFFYDLFIYLKF